ADWDRALKLAPPAQRLGLCLRRADSRARAGDYQRAASDADNLARSESLPGATLYDLACIQALNAASAGRDAARPLPERDRRSAEYAGQAVALLRRAAAAGHFRGPNRIAEMDKDADLAALQDRDDYKRFRRELRPSDR